MKKERLTLEDRILIEQLLPTITPQYLAYSTGLSLYLRYSSLIKIITDFISIYLIVLCS